MDGDRLFGLLDKLGSNKQEVRLRSCRSLQFKLRHQLIDCSEAAVVGKIAEALVRSMTSSQAAPRTEESREEVELVVDIIRACRPCLCTEAALAAVTANLIELLQQLVDSAMLPTVIQIEVKTLLRELQEYSPPEPPAALAAAKERSEPSPFMSKESIEGAGAILYSRLCYFGIHLPTIKLCDADERFLFDIEVKLKVRHESCRRMLPAVVEDFPAAILFQRPSLLFSILDLIGLPFSQADLDMDQYGLHPVGAILLLTKVLRKSVEEMRLQLDGGLCSDGPPSRVVEIDRNSSSQEDLRLEQMAGLMQQLRYPALFADPYLSPCLGPGAIPAPSLSGFAFAAIAAALPLLLGQDLSTLMAIQSLALVAFPLLMEPATMNDNPADKMQQNTSTASNINRQRLQHLIHRFDQLLTILSPRLDFFDMATNVLSSPSMESSDDIALSFFEVGLTRLVLGFLDALPFSLLCRVDPTDQPLLFFPAKLVVFLKMLLCHGQRLSTWIDMDTMSRTSEILSIVSKEDSLLLQRSKAMVVGLAVLDGSEHSHLPALWGNEMIDYLLGAIENTLPLLLSDDPPIKTDSDNIVATLALLLKHAASRQQLPHDVSVILLHRTLKQIQAVVCLAPLQLRFRCLVTISNVFVDNNLHFADARHLQQAHFLEQRLAANDSFASEVDLDAFLAVWSQPVMLKLMAWNVLCWEKDHSEALFFDRNGVKNEEPSHQLVQLRSVLSLLSRCCRYLLATWQEGLQYSRGESSEVWKTVLNWLKALEWSYGEQKDNFDLQPLSQLIQLIESELSAKKDEEGEVISNICGLFHRLPSVRAQAVLLLEKHFFELYRVASKTASLDKSERMPASQLQNRDIFFDGNQICSLLNFSSNYHLSTSQSSLVAQYTSALESGTKGQANASIAPKSLFSYTDVHKLVKILSNRDLDLSIRMAAIEQLMEMLKADLSLLRTLPTSMQSQLLKEAMQELRSSLGNVVLTIWTRQGARIDDWSPARGKFLAILLELAVKFVRTFPALLDQLAFHGNYGSNASAGKVDCEAALLLVIHASTLSEGLRSEEKASLQRTAWQCFLFLHAIAFHSRLWAISGVEDILNSDQELSIQSHFEPQRNGQGLESSSSSMMIPDFLSMWFGHLKCNLSNEMEGLPELTVVGLVFTAPHKEPLHDWTDSALMQSLKDDLSCDMNHSMPWQLLGNLLRHADNHVTLQAILRMARTCLVYQNNSSQEISSEHFAVFLEGFQDMFKGHLQNVNAELSFSHAINLLELLVDFQSKRTSSDPAGQETVALKKILDDVMPIICDYLKRTLPQTTSSSSKTTPSYPLILNVHAHVVSFLRVLLLNQSWPWQDLLYLSEVLQILLSEAVLNDDYDLHIRAMILQMIEDLMSAAPRLGIQDLLNEVTSQGSKYILQIAPVGGQTRHPFLAVCIRLAKWLQIPDSFRGSSVQIRALRVIAMYLRKNKKDLMMSQHLALSENSLWTWFSWHWLQRLLYDRRGEVKILALQIIQDLLSLGNYGPFAVRENEKENDFVESKGEIENDVANVRECLLHIVVDRQEAPLLRAIAMSIWFRWTLSGSRSSNDLVMVHRLLECAAEILSDDHFGRSRFASDNNRRVSGNHRVLSFEILHIIRSVQTLCGYIALQSKNEEGEACPSILKSLVDLRILPQLLALSDPNVRKSISQQRLLVFTEESLSDCYSSADHFYLPKYVSCCLREWKMQLEICSLSVDELLFQLYYDHLGIYRDCIQRTNKLSFLLNDLITTFDPAIPLITRSLEESEVKVHHFNVMMFILVVSMEDSILRSFVEKSFAKFPNTSMHTKVLQSIAAGYEAILTTKEMATNIAADFVSSSSRWIAFVLTHFDEEQVKAVDVHVRGVFAAMMDYRVYVLLLTVQHVKNVASSLLEKMSAQLDLTMALCFQRSVQCNIYFCNTASAVDSNGGYGALVQFYLQTVIGCGSCLEPEAFEERTGWKNGRNAAMSSSCSILSNHHDPSVHAGQSVYDGEVLQEQSTVGTVSSIDSLSRTVPWFKEGVSSNLTSTRRGPRDLDASRRGRSAVTKKRSALASTNSKW
eukprot:scaffold1829_cov194-Ochromonas_danica.AAC.2